MNDSQGPRRGADAAEQIRTARLAREAAALRENLRKRRRQRGARAATPPDPAPPPAPAPATKP